MSVLRNLNILSQQRLDVPHIRLIESAVAGDFDEIVGRAMSGGKALIVNGFTLAGAVNSEASTLELVVAGGLAVNLNASESGSFLSIPSNRANEVLDGASNPKVAGSFVASFTNYIGIDFVREPDDTTTDLVVFKDPATGEETARQVPLGKTLDYRIVISTVPFSAASNVVPIAKVVTSAQNTVTSIVDARKLMFRLGSGGDVPNASSTYTWPSGRTEPAVNAFGGADKSITNQKDWMDAVMTRLLELGGGTNWFSPTADRNVWSINTDVRFSNGDYFTLTGDAVQWKGVRFYFDNSGSAYYNDVLAGSGTILDQQCIYVDLDRTTNASLTAQIGPIASLGMGTKPGSRWVLAWRSGAALYTRNWRYPVGTIFDPATNLAQGVVKLHAAAPDPMNPKVAMIGANNTLVLATTAVATVAGTFSGWIAGIRGYGLVGSGGNGVEGYGDDDDVSSGASGYGVYGRGGSNFGGGGETAAAGVYGLGGSNAVGGIGVHGVAGTSSNASGVKGEGNGTGAGVLGTGGASGPGVKGEGGAAGHGVHGTTSWTSGAGVRGEGSSTAEGVWGSSAGSSGVLGQSGGVNQFGVSGEGTANDAGGVLGTAHGSGIGTKGLATSGWGVLGVSGTSTGVRGESTSGTAVVGISTTGTGVSGTGGGATNGGNFLATGTGHGVQGTAASTGAGVAGFSDTGPGLRSLQGNCEIPIANEYTFGAAKEGSIIVEASDMVAISGAAFVPPDATTNTTTNWEIARRNFSTNDRIFARVNLPRGATIYSIEALFKNEGWTGSFAETLLTNPVVNLHQATATGTSKTTILSGGTFGTTFSSTPGTIWAVVGAVTPVALPRGSSGTDTGWVTIDWTSGGWSGGGTAFKLGAIRVNYTYTVVDFMV